MHNSIQREKENEPCAEVPIRDVFFSLQEVRDEIVNRIENLPREQLDPLLDQIVSVALKQQNLEGMNISGHDLAPKTASWSGWESISSKPLVCSQVIESPHPYKPGTDMYEAVSFPGASHISIYFDSLTSTEEDRDYVTIFKDQTFTEYWGSDEKYHGAQGRNWPGANGRPPLTIPSDHFTLHFHTDTSVQVNQ